MYMHAYISLLYAYGYYQAPNGSLMQLFHILQLVLYSYYSLCDHYCYMHICQFTHISIYLLQERLKKITWSSTYTYSDVHNSYHNFVVIFICIHNECCPKTDVLRAKITKSMAYAIELKKCLQNERCYVY